MTGKEILRQHIAKTVQLTNDQFDYFFRFSNQFHLKRKKKLSMLVMM